jgi:hypothetical protein
MVLEIILAGYMCRIMDISLGSRCDVRGFSVSRERQLQSIWFKDIQHFSCAV